MAKLPHCSTCPLFKAPGPVWGEGNRDTAKIIYIGQNPGTMEVNAGRPFVGPSGNVLNRQLYETGIRRSELYITNQVKCLTPDNRLPTPAEVAHCKPILKAELKACSAKVVILSGALAFKENIGIYSTLNAALPKGSAYLASDNIMNRRGCVEYKDGRYWIGTIHPAFIMRMPEFRECGPDDLKKAYQVASCSPAPLFFNLQPTTEEIDQYANRIITITKAFSEDVETFGHDNDNEEDDYVGGQGTFDICGFSADGVSALVLDRPQVSRMSPVFRQTNVWRYEHNGPFDNYHVSQEILEDIHANIKLDTMLGTHYLRSYAPKKLKPYVLSIYTTLPYYDRKLEPVNRRFYNAMDVLATWQAGHEMRKRLKQWSLEELFFSTGMPVLPILEEWRAIGLKADIKKLLLFRRFIQDRIDRAALLISKIAGPFFNWNSPKQFAELLYGKWGLPVQYNKKGEHRSVTTDIEARKRLRHFIEKLGESQGKYKIPFYFLSVMDFIAGEEQKLTFLDRVGGDGRIHAYFKAHGTESFRLSSKPNVQNIPIYDLNAWGGARTERAKDVANPVGSSNVEGIGSLRSLIIPDRPEDWILTVDLAQVQLWIYAFTFNVKWLKELFYSGEYLYGVIYEHLYKPDLFFDPAKVIPGQPRTKKMRGKIEEQRIRRAKAVPLGFIFGRSAAAVAEEYGWSVAEGQAYYNWFHGMCPELKTSYDAIKFKMNQKNYIRHIFGQIMHFPNQKLTEAINSHAQSPEAIFIIQSIIQIHNELNRRRLRQRGNRLMLSVHDSLSLNTTTTDTEEVYEDIIIPILCRPIPELGGISLRHDAEVSKTWDWETIEYDDWKHQHGRPDRNSGQALGEQTILNRLGGVQENVGLVGAPGAQPERAPGA